jgi:hypothetical protein
MKKPYFVNLALTLSMTLWTCLYYDVLPEIMPLQYSADGIAHKFGSRMVGAFGLPVAALMVTLAFEFSPKAKQTQWKQKLSVWIVALFSILQFGILQDVIVGGGAMHLIVPLVLSVMVIKSVQLGFQKLSGRLE